MTGFVPPAWYRTLGRILTPVLRLSDSPRLGPWPVVPPGSTWIHAASMGELKGALRLVEALPPGHSIYLTCTTKSGLARWQRHDSRHHGSILPLDSEEVAEAFLDAIKPASAVFFESEAWPCLLSKLQRRNIPVAFVAFRTAPASMRRWKLFSRVFPGWARSAATVWTDGLSPIGPILDLGFADVRKGAVLKWAGTTAATPIPDSHRSAAMSIHLRDLPEIVDMVRRDRTRGWLLFPRRLWLRHPLRILVRLLGRELHHQPSPLPGQVWIAERFGLAAEELRTCPWVWVSEGHDTEEPFMSGAREVWSGAPRFRVERSTTSAQRTLSEIVDWIVLREQKREA